jgi:hypothetical protein
MPEDISPLCDSAAAANTTTKPQHNTTRDAEKERNALIDDEIYRQKR